MGLQTLAALKRMNLIVHTTFFKKYEVKAVEDSDMFAKKVEFTCGNNAASSIYPPLPFVHRASTLYFQHHV